MTTRTLLIELKWDLLVVQIVCHNHTEKFSLLWFYYSVLPEAQKSSFILWYCTTKAKIQLDFQLYIRLTAALFCRLKIFALLDLNLSFFHGGAGWDCFSGMSWRIPLTFCSLLFSLFPSQFVVSDCGSRICGWHFYDFSSSLYQAGIIALHFCMM